MTITSYYMFLLLLKCLFLEIVNSTYCNALMLVYIALMYGTKQTITHTPIINATLYSVEQWMNVWLIRQTQLVYVATGSVMQANFDCMTFPVAMQD